MNGLLIVDKPGGMTSHDVIDRLRRASGEKSFGHLGTLDPMATGVLPVLAGKYTRLAQYFGPLTKGYTGTIRFGYATDTYDAEGKPVPPLSASRKCALDFPSIAAGAACLQGEIMQTPPPFSAKKIAGEPAYRAARRGEQTVLQPVKVVVEEFSIVRFAGEIAEFHVRISSGGYVRALAHELGRAMGCGAHLASLRRVSAGPFAIGEALDLDSLCRRAAAGALDEIMPHPRTLLPEMPAITADLMTAGRLRSGMQVNLPEFSSAPMVRIFAGSRDLIAIGKRLAGTLFQPVTVLM